MTSTTDAGAPTGAPARGPQAPGATHEPTDQPQTGWAVTVEMTTGLADVDPEKGGEVLDALAGHSPGGVTLGPRTPAADAREGVVLGVTFDVTGVATADAAGAAAISIARDALAAAGLPVTGDVLELHVMTWAQQERWLDEPSIPELVGIGEIADLLAVSKQRVDQLRKRPDFPEPVTVLRAGPIWTTTSLSRFRDTWDRTPGRRPRAKTTAAAETVAAS